MTLAFDGLSAIRDVQDAIWQIKRIPPSSQQLIHATKLVGESDSLDRCGIGPGSTLRLALREPFDGDVHVKTLTGKTLTVPLYDTSTIYDLKVLVEEMEWLPRASQRMFYTGVRRVVEDYESVRDLGITPGVTLHLD
jgi:ubiquitin C